MSRLKKDLLRELTGSERRELIRISRSQAAPAVEAIRARVLLVLEDPAGHKTPELVCWLFARGHAPVHAGGWVVAEHGREHPAGP